MSTEKEKIDSRAVSSTTTTSVMDDKSGTPNISKPAVDIPAVVSTSNQEICIAEGCNNIPITHPEWDHEYCSIKCCYNHCRYVFIIV
ncbi:Hypothetical protein CINCED_3A000378 [Cinara cedri]|uniref:Uncharacterized protein n=1 Tax=Cinara cedri TaxID=506608 RepID=A0A5E4MW08_9HEMI|nr:Hypothetical protein CINCED_3A000378 [Cinara cedri]